MTLEDFDHVIAFISQLVDTRPEPFAAPRPPREAPGLTVLGPSDPAPGRPTHALVRRLLDRPLGRNRRERQLEQRRQQVHGRGAGSIGYADFSSGESQHGTAIVDIAETVGAVVIDNTWGDTRAMSNPPTVTGDLTLASGTRNGTATAAGNAIVILSGAFSGNFGGSAPGLGAVQLSGFTGTGSGAALDLARSVLQWTGDLHGAVTIAGALAIPANSFFQDF
jgi:hypothetical protein